MYNSLIIIKSVKLQLQYFSIRVLKDIAYGSFLVSKNKSQINRYPKIKYLVLTKMRIKN